MLADSNSLYHPKGYAARPVGNEDGSDAARYPAVGKLRPIDDSAAELFPHHDVGEDLGEVQSRRFGNEDRNGNFGGRGGGMMTTTTATGPPFRMYPPLDRENEMQDPEVNLEARRYEEGGGRSPVIRVRPASPVIGGGAGPFDRDGCVYFSSSSPSVSPSVSSPSTPRSSSRRGGNMSVPSISTSPSYPPTNRDAGANANVNGAGPANHHHLSVPGPHLSYQPYNPYYPSSSHALQPPPVTRPPPPTSSMNLSAVMTATNPYVTSPGGSPSGSDRYYHPSGYSSSSPTSSSTYPYPYSSPSPREYDFGGALGFGAAPAPSSSPIMSMSMSSFSDFGRSSASATDDIESGLAMSTSSSGRSSNESLSVRDAGRTVLAGIDWAGEKLANLFGLTQPKYRWAMEEHERRLESEKADMELDRLARNAEFFEAGFAV